MPSWFASSSYIMSMVVLTHLPHVPSNPSGEDPLDLRQNPSFVLDSFESRSFPTGIVMTHTQNCGQTKLHLDRRRISKSSSTRRGKSSANAWPKPAFPNRLSYYGLEFNNGRKLLVYVARQFDIWYRLPHVHYNPLYMYHILIVH